MKKLLALVLCLGLLLSGCGQKDPSNETGAENQETTKEPIAYSEPIYVMTTSQSNITSIEDLAGKTLAIQTLYDKESSEYVLSQLAGIDVEIYESEYYQEIPDLINAKKIDAWVISQGPNSLLYDYRHDYVVDDYVTVETYQRPIYEEEAIDPAVLNNDLLNKPFAIMITGIDERVDPSDYKAGRNDVNILMGVNPALKHVTTVSFPRDSYIKNVCTGGTDKLTHFGINGTECIKDSIGELLDLEVEYFVQVSFSSFIELIDSLGGVKVDVPLDMCMDQDSFRDVSQPYCLSKGEDQLLYGEWALALARNRKYDGLYNGDYGRIRNQALIVNGIMERIAENPFLLIWAGLDWKADSLAYHNFDANAQDIAALFNLARSFYDGYTVDNYFVVNNGDTTESGMSIGRIPESSLEIAKLKMQYVLTGKMDEENPYYDDAIVGYITGGAGNYDDKYIGEEYCLEGDCELTQE
ncbi:MAG: LCP family protein [Erysipelotrichaceae bacterium]|nr:LCP family protein [Erysipelotrichaceae bacterium]MDY5252102.1 LCP family protein [Erysipelotrichaceae bacterium]